jgi:hypothetical protein
LTLAAQLPCLAVRRLWQRLNRFAGLRRFQGSPLPLLGSRLPYGFSQLPSHPGVPTCRVKSLLFTLFLALAAPGAVGVNLAAPLVPDPARTPGDLLTSDPKVVCVSGYTQTVRNVPQAVKEQVYRSYGIRSRGRGEYEIDHLISLQLGGSNSVRNLWPQSYKTNPLNAHVKDQLENKLHSLACKGQITLTQTQQAIAQDWRAAYVRYVGPLPGRITSAPVALTPGHPAAPALTTATGSSAAPTAGQCPASAPIKGNIGSRGNIYHVPGERSYTQTKAEQCFSSESGAQAAGFRAPR